MTMSDQFADLHDETGQARKRLFIGLISATSVIVCLILALIWGVSYIGIRNFHPILSWSFSLIMLLVMILVAGAALALVYNIMTDRKLPIFHRMRGLTIKFYLPLMTLLARLFGIPKQRVRSSFIKVNNELVEGKGKTYASEEMLLLMPHCLQSSTCKYRLTYDIRNCRRCGKCPIDGLLTLSDKYGIHLAIATGGTIARRIVVQTRPKLILAVACERDLASGIQDTYPLPTFGVLNERPHGPCLDTQVPLASVEASIRRFLHPEVVAQADFAPLREYNPAHGPENEKDDEQAPVRIKD